MFFSNLSHPAEIGTSQNVTFLPILLGFQRFLCIFTQFIIVLKLSTRVPQCKVAKDFVKMQAKEQKISPIKQRILQFADSLNISKRDFYAKIGVSRGTLESKTGITEDILAKFVATFPEVSIDWLMQGKGEMVKKNLLEGNLSGELTVGLVLSRDEKLIRENERLLIRIEELERKMGIKNSPPQEKFTQSTDK